MKRLLPLLIALAAASAPANAASVRLELSGSDYQGGPAFEISFGRRAVGSGVVDVLAKEGAGAAFEFDVPDLLLAANPPLILRFTNDARGGAGEDRNLYLVSAAVNGEPLALADISVLAGDGVRPGRLRQGRVEIWSSSEYAIVHPPVGGWPLGPPLLRPALAAGIALQSP